MQRLPIPRINYDGDDEGGNNDDNEQKRGRGKDQDAEKREEEEEEEEEEEKSVSSSSSNRRGRKRVRFTPDTALTPSYTKTGKDESGFESSTLHDENPYPSLRALNGCFLKWRLQDLTRRVTMWIPHTAFNPDWQETARTCMGPGDQLVYYRYNGNRHNKNRNDNNKDTLEVNDTILLQDTNSHSQNVYLSRIMDTGSDVDTSHRQTSHLILSAPQLV